MDSDSRLAVLHLGEDLLTNSQSISITDRIPINQYAVNMADQDIFYRHVQDKALGEFMTSCVLVKADR